MSELFGFDAVIDWNDMGRLLSRLALDLVFASAVIRLIYFRLYKNREYVFIYYLFNVITFSLVLLLQQVSIEFGLALALFGVFGILRYRTEQVRIRDLTYLFIVIGLGILNAIADKGVSVLELVFVDGVIVAMTAALEFGPSKSTERSATMIYDQLVLLLPGNEDKLISDISARTGLSASRVEVDQVDLLRDAAEITVYYRHAR